MKNLRSLFIITISFLAFNSSTSAKSYHLETVYTHCVVEENIEEASKDFSASIKVRNRSSYPVKVFIDGRYRGWLRAGAYNNYSVYDGTHYVKAVWGNGYNNWWNVDLCCGRSYNCYTES